MLTTHYVETVAVSDDVARLGDGWQHDLSEGPALESLRRRLPSSARTCQRPAVAGWGPTVASGWACGRPPRCARHRGGGVAALTSTPTGLRPGTPAAAPGRSLAGQLAVAAPAPGCSTAQRSHVARSGMGQAQGIVMERFGLTADQAAELPAPARAEHGAEPLRLSEVIVETREVPHLRDREDDV